MRANGKQPTALRTWVTSVRWQVEWTLNPLHLLVSSFSSALCMYIAVPALPVTVVFASDGHCDRGYLLYKDYCYHFETEQVKNWHDAEAHCTKEQGHLVSFHNEEELSFLTGGQLWIITPCINIHTLWIFPFYNKLNYGNVMDHTKGGV